MTGELNRELLEIVRNRKPGIPTYTNFKADKPPCPILPHEPCACLDREVLPEGTLNACSAIHYHFGLSYANYLVLPRSVLQSMPKAWQARFVGLLKELGEAWEGPEGEYSVMLLKGEYIVHDEMADYERGRRQVPLKGDDDSEYVKARKEYDAAADAARVAERRLAVAGRRIAAIIEKLSAPLKKLITERNT